ncbi:hypothetical protein G6F56_009733 [Rhizopus delemar]|nr:hypothetical protein G6F56_009733 [Rhizopus delemar]
MEKSESKGEYIALPSEELPAYETKKSGLKWSTIFVFLIGVPLTLFALHKTFLAETSIQESYRDAPEPCMLRHNLGYNELKQFVQELEYSMGPVAEPHHQEKDHLTSFEKHKKPFCKLHKLEAESTVFEFSPETYQKTKILLNGETNRGGHVTISKSTDESIQDIKVNITVYAGRSELFSEVEISAYESKGDYVVQLERDTKGPHFPHHRHHKPKQEDCLVYSVDIQFPSTVDYYEGLEFHAKKAQRIEGGKGIEDIQFGSVKAGLGWGAIIFDTLKADNIKLAVLHGVVMGTYQPKDNFLAVSVKGATKVHIEPTSEQFNITATSTFGPATVDLPAESFSGDFGLFHFFGSSPTIKAPNPEDIHVTKSRHGVRAGYYKETQTGSRVILSAKFHGSPSLYLN